MPIYQSHADPAPDHDFEPGELAHLVPGNTGRALDPRRTPVRIVGLRPDVGFVVLRIEDFEDAGALWEIPFEDVGHYQFARDSLRADADSVATFAAAVERFDRRIERPCDLEARRATEARLHEAALDAADWLAAHGTVPGRGHARGSDRLPGDAERARLQRDLAAYMQSRELADIERGFARQFVSGPHAGEIVKGHAIVLAELGLVPYAGKVVRDPATFEGAWDRPRRAAHLVTRLGFTRSLLQRLGLERVTLYRGLSVHGALQAPHNDAFVSASFDEAVARSHFDAAGNGATRALMAQSVPCDRVLMTYLETPELNHPFQEAEAVLLFEPGNLAF